MYLTSGSSKADTLTVCESAAFIILAASSSVTIVLLKNELQKL